MIILRRSHIIKAGKALLLFQVEIFPIIKISIFTIWGCASDNHVLSLTGRIQKDIHLFCSCRYITGLLNHSFYKAGFWVSLIVRSFGLFSGENCFSERVFHVMMSSGSETILFILRNSRRITCADALFLTQPAGKPCRRREN